MIDHCPMHPRPLKQAAADAEHREFVESRENRQRAFGEFFLDVAREMLDPDVFTTLMREATLRKSRDLVRYEGSNTVGAALGMNGGASGFKQRKG